MSEYFTGMCERLSNVVGRSITLTLTGNGLSWFVHDVLIAVELDHDISLARLHFKHMSLPIEAVDGGHFTYKLRADEPR